MIIPTAKALYLCDHHLATGGKADLYGIFGAIRPPHGYPHIHKQFCVFAQLTNGLGAVPFFVDVRDAETDTLVHTTKTRHLNFPDRTTVMQLALTIEGCRFERPSLYLIELFCDNTWVCDARSFCGSETDGRLPLGRNLDGRQ
jgi:hypothetical protein